MIKEVQQTSGKNLKRLSLWIDASFMPVNFVSCNQRLYENFLKFRFLGDKRSIEKILNRCFIKTWNLFKFLTGYFG